MPFVQGLSRASLRDFAQLGAYRCCHLPLQVRREFYIMWWPWHKKTQSPQEYIADRQRVLPPVYYKQDGGQQLFTALAQRLPPDVRALFEAGTIGGGEVGDMSAEARMKELDGSKYAIEFFSGLMRLFYSCSRIIGARATVHTRPPTPDASGVLSEPPDSVVKPSVTDADGAQLIAMLFREYQRTGIAGVQQFPIHAEQIRIADMYAREAEIFILAHESGHAWKRASHKPVSVDPETNEEIVADGLAGTWFLEHLANPAPGLSPRMMYAGSEMALRIFASMEKIGIKFCGTHPPAGKRLEAFRALARRVCKSEADYMSLSTIAVASDQLWDHVEAILTSQNGQVAPVELTVDRLESTLIVLVQETQSAAMTLESAIVEAQSIIKGASGQVLDEATRRSRDFFAGQPAAAAILDSLLGPTSKGT